MDDTKLVACHQQVAQPCFVDVVFVHGLRGDARATWSRGTEGGDSPTWPHWVAEDLPGARVWSAGYPSTLIEWGARTLPIASLAGNLAHRLRSQRDEPSHLVWVGHSMGGLIVKQILCDAAISSNVDIRRVWLDTRAVMFLGTPHSGSDLASLKAYLGRLLQPGLQVAAATAGAGLLAAAWSGLRRLGRTTSRPMANVDELQSNATALAALNHSFQQHAATRYVQANVPSIVAYRETQTLWGALVVEPHSADPHIAHAEVVDLPENHETICKPKTRDAAPHKWLVTQVRRLGSSQALAHASAMAAGRVFISYVELDPTVSELAIWLRRGGVEIDIDLDFIGSRAPVGGWTRWARECVARADTVLVVGHADYPELFEGASPKTDDPDFGRAIVTREIYCQPGMSPDKFIPLLKDGDSGNCLPQALRDWWSGLRFPKGQQAILDALRSLPVSQAHQTLTQIPLPPEASP